MEMKWKHSSFGRRLGSMLAVDFRRMFTMRLLYIMLGVCLAMPVLTLVMTSAMSGGAAEPQMGAEAVADSGDTSGYAGNAGRQTGGEIVEDSGHARGHARGAAQQRGRETVMDSGYSEGQTSGRAAPEGFTNAWQAIGSVSGEGSAMNMDLMSMCNINMLYFFIAVLVCLFVSEDFKSGYAKNLFTVRPRKGDYVISKTLVGFTGGALMLLSYFAGAMLGGAIAGLSFDTGAAGSAGIVMCMLSKIFLAAVFVPIYLLVSVCAKQKTWLSIIGSFCIAMLLYMMIPALTPLDAGMMNVLLCLAGGVLFGAGLGAVSNVVLRKTSLV